MADARVPVPDSFAGLSLAEIAARGAMQSLPPVDQWDPPHCGHSGMAIDVAGQWYHDGRPIARPALVALFASLLRREPDGSYVLVTPVEKLTIDVADVPFVAVELATGGEGRDRSLVGAAGSSGTVIAGPDHPLRFAVAADGTPRPYVHVRGAVGHGLEALIARAPFYELAELALAESPADGPAGLWSGGQFFALPG
jgi:hypothetical protein